ncbi:MAG: hypothetical protein WBO97_01715 [Tepidiformaceae bacterium]
MSHFAVADSQNRVSVYSLPEHVSDPPTSTTEITGIWPVPRPGSEWTVSVVDDSSRLEHRSGIGATEVPGSSNAPPALIGARLAHYAAWSPSGERLSYVVPDGRALSLRTWVPGDTGFHALVSAAPVFPAWVPGSNWLLCHHGPTLSAFDTSSSEQRILSAAASGFRTPAVSSDGSRIAWAEVSGGRVVVFVGSLTGGPEAVASFPGGVVLSFRPQTNDLHAAVASSPESGVFGEIVRIDSGGRPPQRILQGPVVAYWWSPDGDKLATLHPTYSGDGRFQVRFYGPAGEFLGAMEPIIPSADTATLVGFFDQYAVSHPCWSADGRWFGIAGRRVSEGPHPSFSGGDPNSAFIWDTRAKVAPVAIPGGSLVVFERSAGK